jgi:hypothetical protein
MPKQTRKAFEVKPKGWTYDDLANELATAIEDAESVRTATTQEVSYWHTLYEQGRTRTGKNAPWQDAADLTSHLGTQYVDAMRARIMDTVFVEPVYTVEGWGEAAKNAPFVEEFHQWQIEEEGFQTALSRAIHLSLIEPCGVLEVYEDTTRRPVRKTIQAKWSLAPDGTALVGADLTPIFEQKDGKYVEATADEPAGELEIDSYEVICRGPRHRVIPYRDFLRLPGHAVDRGEIWGYAKRFKRRVEELTERVQAGQYDKQAVEDLGTDEEVTSETTLADRSIGVAQGRDGREQKELWELLFLKDLDGTGLRWYVTTLSVQKRTLLRLQYDDIGRPRFFSLVPFPRPNSTEGYSLIGHKLITSIEEHTAWRNMDADRGAMQLQMPMKVQQGALWDPDAEPIGAKAVIWVRDMREIEPIQIQDVTGTAEERITRTERSAEKIVGMTDVATGSTPLEKRTATETSIVNEMSNIRVKEVIKNIQEPLEEIAQVRHVMWKRALKDMGEEGLPAPSSVSARLQMRDPQLLQQAHGGEPQQELGLEARAPNVASGTTDLRFTLQMMEGAFRFKPHGSVETANLPQQRQDFSQYVQAMAMLSQVNPMIGGLMQTPQAAKALMAQGLRLFHVQDQQAFLGSEAMQAVEQQAQNAPPHPDQAKIDADKQMAEDKNKATLEITRMNNEAKLAVAELGATMERLALFLDERARLGTQQQDVHMAELQHQNSLAQTQQQGQQAAQQADQAHQQALEQAKHQSALGMVSAEQGQAHALEQGQQAADLAPPPAQGGA